MSDAQDTAEDWYARWQKVKAANRRLLAELKEARDNVESWGAYADPYFQEKWDLKGDLARIDAVLKENDHD